MSRKSSPIGYRVTKPRTGAQIEADEKKAAAAAKRKAAAGSKAAVKPGSKEGKK